MFEPGSEIGPPCSSKATQSLTTNVGDRSGHYHNFYSANIFRGKISSIYTESKLKDLSYWIALILRELI